MTDAPAVLVPLAPGFEEIEAITIIDVLRRAGCRVTTVGLNDLAVEGAHGIRVEADNLLMAVVDDEFAAMVLPGGMPGSTNLRDDPGVQERLKREHAKGTLLAAVCAAPIALEAAGVLEGKRATCYPSFREHLKSAQTSDDKVVEDGAVITSQGPGTSLAFALALVKRLVGSEKAEQLKQGMLAAV